MNYSRLGLAALGGTVAHFAFGFLVFWLLPGLIKEGRKYAAVFRPKEEIRAATGVILGARLLGRLIS